jgi:carbonic anhydrase
MCAECAKQEISQPLDRLHRRRFLKASVAITAMAFVGTGALSTIAHADALTKAQRDKLSPDDILALMKKGNKRFYTGKRENHNFLAQQRASAKGQYPAAVLLTCIDSRASAETILDRRYLQQSRGRQCRKCRHPWQYGVRLQIVRGQGGSSHGPYGVRRD